MIRIKLPGVIGLSLLAVFTNPSFATSTDVVLNLEGNPTCSSLGDNSTILEFRDSSPGGTKSVILPTTDGGTQVLDYEVGFDSILGVAEVVSWEISGVSTGSVVNPINYVILKAQGGKDGARVFHFGSAEDGDGAVSDDDENATGSKLSALSFCYGLTSGYGEEPPGDEPIPDCLDYADPVTGEIIIDGTVIGSCPTDTSEERLLISLDLYAPDFDLQSCTCNVDGGLPVCDPELSVDEEGACMVTTGAGGGVNERVPVIIQGVENPDSYICYTIGGKRKCYGHF
jgi:hypothetical protein